MTTKKQIFGVVLPLDVAQHARVWAILEHKSRSQLMRELLEKYLAEREGDIKEVEISEGAQDAEH
jgi:metal-responsive CopG/Arc/MetJ family transcriptional regulator